MPRSHRVSLRCPRDGNPLFGGAVEMKGVTRRQIIPLNVFVLLSRHRPLKVLLRCFWTRSQTVSWANCSLKRSSVSSVVVTFLSVIWPSSDWLVCVKQRRPLTVVPLSPISDLCSVSGGTLASMSQRNQWNMLTTKRFAGQDLNFADAGFRGQFYKNHSPSMACRGR